MKVIAVATTLPPEDLGQADVVVNQLTDILLTVKSREIQIEFKKTSR
jgi:hypothetical protein